VHCSMSSVSPFETCKALSKLPESILIGFGRRSVANELGPGRPQHAVGRLEGAPRSSGRVAWTSLGVRPSPNRST
jgi:hypothetical protein